MFTRFSRGMLVAVPVLALALNAYAQAPAGKTEAAPAPAAKAQEGAKDIVDTAMAAPNLKTLVDLLKAAGLVEELKKPGPFTVFAPTDDAFAKLGKDIDDLKKPENKEKLAGILKAHVAKGKMLAADVQKAKDIPTLNGTLMVMVKDGKVMLNEKVGITKTDIQASNGVVHLVDAVIMPGAKPAAAPAPAEKKPADKPAEKKEGAPAEKKH